jgi:transposase
MANRKGPQRDAAKQRYWRTVVRRHTCSGQSVREFCRGEGLSEASFYAWRRELSRRDGETVEPAAPHSLRADRDGLKHGPRFLPITVVPDSPTPLVCGVVEVAFPSGAVLRLPAATKPGMIAAVLSAWERRQC